MNTQKYHLHNARLLEENDRSLYQKEKENGEVCYDSTSKSRIDFSRTELNYNLCPHEPYTRDEIIKTHEDIRGKRFPKNGVLFGSTVITLPKDFDGDSKTFFETAYDGLKELYKLNDSDIISSFVHMDETNPHMHFNFVPRFENTISWEKMFPKTLYESQHNRLETYMNSKNIGEVHLLNGETLGFDVQCLTQDQKSVSMEIYHLKSLRDDIYSSISKFENQKLQIQKDISYYFDNGNSDKVEELTLQWNFCNQEIARLVKEKKDVAIQLEEKFMELNNGSKVNATQKQIFELVADKSHLEEICFEKVVEVKNMESSLLQISNEIKERYKDEIFLEKVDNIMKQISKESNTPLPYDIYKEGFFKNKKQYYLVPEVDMQAFISSGKLSTELNKQFIELENRNTELDKKEDELIRDIQVNNAKRLKLDTKEKELYQKEKELDSLIDAKATEKYKLFLGRNPQIADLFQQFLKHQRQQMHSHGFDR